MSGRRFFYRHQWISLSQNACKGVLPLRKGVEWGCWRPCGSLIRGQVGVGAILYLKVDVYRWCSRVCYCRGSGGKWVVVSGGKWVVVQVSHVKVGAVQFVYEPHSGLMETIGLLCYKGKWFKGLGGAPYTQTLQLRHVTHDNMMSHNRKLYHVTPGRHVSSRLSRDSIVRQQTVT